MSSPTSSSDSTAGRGHDHDQDDVELSRPRASGTDMALQGKTMSSATVLSPQGMWYRGRPGSGVSGAPGRPAQHRTGLRTPSGLAASSTAVPGLQGRRTRHGHRRWSQRRERPRHQRRPPTSRSAIEASGRIHSTTFRDRNSDGEYGTFSLTYSDFRPVEGLQLPFNTRATFNGQPQLSLSMTLETISLNTPLDASLFAPKTQGGQ